MAETLYCNLELENSNNIEKDIVDPSIRNYLDGLIKTLTNSYS